MSTPPKLGSEESAGIMEDDELIPSSQSTESQLPHTLPPAHDEVCRGDIVIKQSSGESTASVDYEDFIPSSQSTESQSLPSTLPVCDGDSKEDATTTPRKRKLEGGEVVSNVDCKIPRVEVEESCIISCKPPSDVDNKLEDVEILSEEVNTPVAIKNPTTVTIAGNEVEMLSPKKDKTASVIPASLNVKRSIDFEENKISDEVIVTSDTEVSNDKSLLVGKVHTSVIESLSKGEDLADEVVKDKSVKDNTAGVTMEGESSSRKSVVVVFESLSLIPKKAKESLQPIIEIEDEVPNDVQQIESDLHDDDSFHLHFSPSQNHLDSSHDDVQSGAVKQYDTQSSSSTKLTPSDKSSSERSWNSHNQSQSSVSHEEKTCTWNSHGENVKNGPEITTVEDDDVEILPSDGDKSQSSNKTVVSNSHNSGSSSGEKSLTSNDCTIINDDHKQEGDKIMEVQFSLNTNEILTPEGLTPISDSCNVFSRVKEVANMKDSEKFLLPNSESQGVSFKRKRNITEDNLITILGSDSESDGQFSPAVPQQDIRKKSRVERELTSQETNNTPETVPFVIKEKYQSTPCGDFLQISANESISSIEVEGVKDHTPCHTSIQENISPESTSSEKVIEMEGEGYLKFGVRWKIVESTRQIVSWEVTQWEDMKDDVQHFASRSSDVSSGVLGDVSEQSGVSSFGPFQLVPRRSSLISSSSSSSAGTSVSGQFYSAKSKFPNKGNFTVPTKRAHRTVGDKSVSMANVSVKASFQYPDKFHSLKPSELVDLIEKRLHLDSSSESYVSLGSVHTSESDENKGKIHTSSESLGTQELVTMSAKQEMESKLSKRTLLDSDTKTDQEEKVAVEEVTTPKSTKKTHLRPTRATRNTNKGSALKAIKEVAPAKSAGSSRKDEPKVAVIHPSRTRKGRGDRSDGVLETFQSPEVTQSMLANKSLLEPDAPAFARWTDRKYYSATVKEKLKDDRWVVRFDDGNNKTLKEEFVIPINILNKGQIVFALVDEDYEEGIITKYEVKDGEVHHGVEIQGGITVFVPRSKLFMTEDQAKILQETFVAKATPTTPKSTAVSLDNVVQGKRSRTSNRSLFGTIEKPGVSGIAKLTPKKRDTSGSSSEIGSSASALEDIVGVDPESHVLSEPTFTPKIRGKGPGKIKGKGRSTPRRNTLTNLSTSEADDSEVIEQLGPIPPRGSKIFSGMHFLITHTGVKTVNTDRLLTGNSEASLDESQTSAYDDDKYYPVGTFAFEKHHLKQQLETGGGIVYDHFEDVPEQVYSVCYLISDRPCETAKYIQCVAHGIRPVSHEWVVQKTKCKDDNRSITNSYLPTGYALQKKCFISEPIARKQKPLNNKQIALVNDSKRFLKFWARILEALGAKVQEITPDEVAELSETAKVIVSDSSCPPGIRDRAQQWGIPLVSTVWVKQCLISGKVQPSDGHISYRYDYCSD